MSVRALVLGVLVLVAVGCGKKTYSPFYALEGKYSVLVADQGDPGFLTPEMDSILQGLQAVPDNAREKERAEALVATITSTRARLEAEAAAAQNPTPTPTVAPPPRLPSFGTDAPLPKTPGTATSRDAGQVDAQPTPGMSLAAFQQQFGDCFSAAPQVAMPDGKKVEAQQLKSTPDCLKRFQGEPNTTTLYLFNETGLYGTRSLSTTQQPTPPAPQATPTVATSDAGPPVYFVPGMPIPEPLRPQTPQP